MNSVTLEVCVCACACTGTHIRMSPCIYMCGYALAYGVYMCAWETCAPESNVCLSMYSSFTGIATEGSKSGIYPSVAVALRGKGVKQRLKNALQRATQFISDP